MKNHLLYTFTLFLCLLAVSCKDSDPGGGEPTLYKVSVAVEPAGAGAVDGAGTFEAGEAIQLSATPAEGYRFTGWSGDAEGTDNPLSLSVDKAYSLTARFELKDYALSVATDGEGTVAETVLQAKDYAHGTLVELTATPAENWVFTGWQGDLSGDENPAQLTIDSPKEVTAIFEKKTYPLTVTTQGQGAVAEEVITAKSYAHGTLVELTASPATGWEFVEWQGALDGTDNPARITVDEAKEVTAVFEEKDFYLAANGVTIMCPGVAVGDSFTLGEITYTRRSKDQITEANAATTCTSGITDMSSMFAGEFMSPSSFNEDISHWDVSSVTTMANMFKDADAFNQPISHWDVGAVTDMSYMFYNAAAFNADLSGWDVSKVTDMASIFASAAAFDQDLSAWNVSSVTDMTNMFRGAAAFNQPIGDWDVGAVMDMQGIFSNTAAFDQPIGGWDVSSVTDMTSMFTGAAAFNQPIGDWDVSNVISMSSMFSSAAAFDQDLSGWCVSKISSKPLAFDGGAGFEGDATRQPQWGTCPE